MSTLGRISSKVGVGAGALFAVGVVAAASAFAAPVTYTVSVGGSTSGVPVAVTGTTQPISGSSNQIIFNDTTSGLGLGCASGTATGKVTKGTAVAANKVGKINKTTWKTCAGPGGIALSPKQSGTWTIAASGKTVGGKTKANVTGVKAVVTGTGCSFTVTGTATGSFDNATSVLSLAPLANPTAAQKLTVSGVSGCFGVINNGDNVTFQANYKLAATGGALLVTSN